MNVKKMILGAVCSSFCVFGAYHGDCAVKDTTQMTITVDKKAAFNLNLLKGWTFKKSEYKYILIPPAKYPHIQLWYLKDNKNIASAEKDIAEIIKSEVLNFKISKKSEIKVANKAGVILTGSGLEADDQDPSNAEVFLFEVNSKVYVLCVHGEGDEAAKHSPDVKKMLTTIKTDKK